MSDDHFYPRAYGRLSVAAQIHLSTALYMLEQIKSPRADVVRADIQRVLDEVAAIDAQRAERMAAIEARMNAYQPIIPVEVQ